MTKVGIELLGQLKNKGTNNKQTKCDHVIKSMQGGGVVGSEEVGNERRQLGKLRR